MSKHSQLLNERKKTVFMKANTNSDGILMAALNEDDVQRVVELISDCKIVHFECGCGIHIQKQKEFVQCLLD